MFGVISVFVHGPDLRSEGSHGRFIIRVRQLDEGLVSVLVHQVTIVVMLVSSKSSGELHVLSHDRHSLGVESAESGIFENADEIGLRCLLQGEESLGLEAEIIIDASGYVPHQSLEWCSRDEEVGGLLVPLDLSERDGSRLEPGLLSLLGPGGGGGLSLGGRLGDFLGVGAGLGLGWDLLGSVLCFWHVSKRNLFNNYKLRD